MLLEKLSKDLWKGFIERINSLQRRSKNKYAHPLQMLPSEPIIEKNQRIIKIGALLLNKAEKSDLPITTATYPLNSRS